MAVAYSSVTDLLKGDIPLPSRYGDGTNFVTLAAEEIDSYIGSVYETPVDLADTPANRPARLLLKKINNFLASGRLIIDMAISSEDRDLHAYGRRLLDEAVFELNRIRKGEVTLGDATLLPGVSEDTGPVIHNEDPESLVESFYQQTSHGIVYFPQAPAPYRDARLVAE